jgi:hypothetical protein
MHHQLYHTFSKFILAIFVLGYDFYLKIKIFLAAQHTLKPVNKGYPNGETVVLRDKWSLS